MADDDRDITAQISLGNVSIADQSDNPEAASILGDVELRSAQVNESHVIQIDSENGAEKSNGYGYSVVSAEE